MKMQREHHVNLNTVIWVSRTGQVVWDSYLFQNFPQSIVIHTVKGFGIVNKAEIDVFLEASHKQLLYKCRKEKNL